MLPQNIGTPQKDADMFLSNSYSASHVPMKSNSTEKTLQFILSHRHPADANADGKSVQGLKTEKLRHCVHHKESQIYLVLNLSYNTIYITL